MGLVPAASAFSTPPASRYRQQQQHQTAPKHVPWSLQTSAQDTNDDSDGDDENDDDPFPVNARTAHAPPDSTLQDSTFVQLRDTQRRLQEQDKKIDLLLQLVQQQQQQQTTPQQTTPQQTTPLPPLPPLPAAVENATTTNDPHHLSSVLSSVHQEPVNWTENARTSTSSSATDTTATNGSITPLKVMLFIDGTWLYYSIHERGEQDCPIIRRYGKLWQNRYSIDWSALPQILCESLEDPLMVAGRPAEIVRASVFTSYKADTSPNSWRYKMFQELKAANYDVHMMETVGKSEKCVDIQLAVEMLHYATVPGAYDVALLLTGDKDFMPAMIRTRQKGRKVGLVSMRRGCNRALHETPGLIDYSVIWLEQHLDRLVVPKQGAAAFPPVHKAESYVGMFTLMKTVNDFISASGYDRVSSRDLGRYLKKIEIGGESILDIIKESYGGRGGGGLTQFLTDAGVYDVEKRSDELYKEDPTDRAVWVRLRDHADACLTEEATKAKFSPEEKAFFDIYSLKILQDTRNVYGHTALIMEAEKGGSSHRALRVSPVLLAKLIDNFITESGFDHVSSRDLGKYLKSLNLDGQPILEEIKRSYGSLAQFLRDSNLFDIGTQEGSTAEFLVGRQVGSDDITLEHVQRSISSSEEKLFLDSYSIEALKGDRTAYWHTRGLNRAVQGKVNPQEADDVLELPEELTKDYSVCTVVELKERCRERKLAVSGVKAALLERIHTDLEKQVAQYKDKQPSANIVSRVEPPTTHSAARHDDAYLVDLVSEYLRASGGQATSRKIGRYLAANDALQQLKSTFGNLAGFVNFHSDTFTKLESSVDLEFHIVLKRGTPARV